MNINQNSESKSLQVNGIIFIMKRNFNKIVLKKLKQIDEFKFIIYYYFFFYFFFKLIIYIYKKFLFISIKNICEFIYIN